MPGKHAPASPRSFYTSLGRALGAALGAVAVMVIVVVVWLSRGDHSKPSGLPVVQTSRPAVSSPSPTPKPANQTLPATSVLPAAKVTVQVLNGTARNGLARQTADKIQRAGYKVTGTGNAKATPK